jgi:predicted HTH transcriptional regulator
MARIENDMVEGLRGKVGNKIVYKTRNGKTFATQYPDRSKVVSTTKQAKGRKKFAAAVKFARAILKDPEKKAIYTKKGNTKKGKEASAYATAIRSYLDSQSAKKLDGFGTYYIEAEDLQQLAINERQKRAVLYINKYETLTNGLYQQINTVSKATATRDLQELVKKNLVVTDGKKGAGARYKMGSNHYKEYPWLRTEAIKA